MSRRFRQDGRASRAVPKAHARPCEATEGPRHDAEEERVWLGWWEEDRFTAWACLLRQIGREGALVIVPELPPMHQTLWLRLDRGGELTPSVPATLASAGAAGPGKLAARIAFAEPCPASLLHAAVVGLGAHQAALN